MGFFDLVNAHIQVGWVIFADVTSVSISTRASYFQDYDIAHLTETSYVGVCSNWAVGFSDRYYIGCRISQLLIFRSRKNDMLVFSRTMLLAVIAA